MSKILYIETVRNVRGSGGSYITERNKNSLRKYFGEENYFEYKILPYKNVLEMLFWSIFNYIGGMRFRDNLRLKRILKDNKDCVVFVDTSLIGFLSRRIFLNHNVLYFFQNVEYLYAIQEIKNKSFVKKCLLNIQLKAIYKNESLISKYAKSIITLNSRDSEELKRIYGRPADFLWPTTFDDKFNEADKKNDEKYMLFVGSKFYGNVEGITWFINNCLPHIDYKLKVVGSGMDSLKHEFSNSNVEFIGFVDDLSEVYLRASFVVLPIISGSGMKTKTCEALMYGKKVFGTREAFEGYENISEAKVVLCENEEEFIGNINEYIKKEENNFERAARFYFLNNYSTDVVNRRLFEFLESMKG